MKKSKTSPEKWSKFLKAYYEHRVTIGASFGYAGETFEPFIFEEEKHAKDVQDLIENIIGGWDEVKKWFKKGREELIVFAVNSESRAKNPVKFDYTQSLDAILFYDKNTGECYKYEEADFSPFGPWNTKKALRLDELKLKKLK